MKKNDWKGNYIAEALALAGGRWRGQRTTSSLLSLCFLDMPGLRMGKGRSLPPSNTHTSSWEPHVPTHVLPGAGTEKDSRDGVT